jgi:anti-sigma factor RsiW
MDSCQAIREQMAFYLDGELYGGELAAFEEHLAGCAACHQRCAQERRWLSGVREARPLYPAPPALRERVERLLAAAPAPHLAPPALRERVRRSLRPRGGRRALVLAVTTALLLLALAVYFPGRRGREFDPPSEFARMAVGTHLRHERGQLPFEISGDSPEQVSAWFAGKVPFSLKLPNYQESSGQEKLYRIEGGRLVAFRNDYAAYIGYQMRGRPITLVVTSQAVAQPAGGERITSRGLTFHYASIDGLKVITWADRGLTYALVSDLEERGQQSCIVCHEGTRDRDFIEGLRPGRRT